jgi:hypothetical protein
MRCTRLFVSPVLVLGPCVVAALASACAFKPQAEGIPAAGGSALDGGAPGTGGATFSYDGPLLSDAPREYVSSDDGSIEQLQMPTADANCGNQPFKVIAPPPDLLILLDRSGSMAENAMGQSCRPDCGVNSKWYQVTTAINMVVGATEGTIHWGLKFFGTDNACAVAAGAAVPPGLNNAKAIADAIALPANQPASRTPTAAGELSAGAYLATVTDTNPKFILLATDGAPNCGVGLSDTTANDSMGAKAAVTTVKEMGFPTFVIGIAAPGDATTTLNELAVNGGYPRMATGTEPQYYSVSTTDDLVKALGAIQTITMGMCTYPLGEPDDKADVSKVSVTVDGVPSTQDDPDGWHFDPGNKSITFTGSTCEKLMKGTLRDVQVLYGCKFNIT